MRTVPLNHNPNGITLSDIDPNSAGPLMGNVHSGHPSQLMHPSLDGISVQPQHRSTGRHLSRHLHLVSSQQLLPADLHGTHTQQRRPQHSGDDHRQPDHDRQSNRPPHQHPAPSQHNLVSGLRHPTTTLDPPSRTGPAGPLGPRRPISPRRPIGPRRRALAPTAPAHSPLGSGIPLPRRTSSGRGTSSARGRPLGRAHPVRRSSAVITSGPSIVTSPAPMVSTRSPSDTSPATRSGTRSNPGS
jgi:hypothetical protein